MNVDSVAEKLVSRCIASLPNGEDPSVAIAKDTSGIAKAVESIQDRYVCNWCEKILHLRRPPVVYLR
jgi:hypothetical protein